MRQSVKQYLRGRSAFFGKKTPVITPINPQEVTTGSFPEVKQSHRKQGDCDDINEELATELLLQGHSYPKFYFKNLFF